MISLLKNKKYMLLALTLTNLYFVVSGIQYWITKYLQVVLKVEETTAQTFFSLTCLTAPVSGVIIGGSITTYFGGFESVKA
jgi:sugar phosphate permease